MNDVFKTHGAVSWIEAESKDFHQALLRSRFEDMVMAKATRCDRER